jgi:aminoglycoside 6'-N-acetyltransferase I
MMMLPTVSGDLSQLPLPGVYQVAAEREVWEGWFASVPTGWQVLRISGVGVTDKQSLLTAVARAGQFPDYFGYNWDALDEMMRDLSWLTGAGYLIWLEDFAPLAAQSPHVWGQFVQILAETTAVWQAQNIPMYILLADGETGAGYPVWGEQDKDEDGVLGVVTRPCQLPDEWDAWFAMRQELWPDDPASQEADMHSWLRQDPATVIVAALPDGTLVGFAEVGTRSYAPGCDTSPVAYMEGWFVAEPYRRQGIGRALFAAAEAWGRAQGCTEMGSDTDLDNDISQVAHAALGYEEIERSISYRKAL